MNFKHQSNRVIRHLIVRNGIPHLPQLFLLTGLTLMVKVGMSRSEAVLVACSVLLNNLCRSLLRGTATLFGHLLWVNSFSVIGLFERSYRSYFLGDLNDFLFDLCNDPLKIWLPNLLILWRPRGSHPVALRKAFIQRATYFRWFWGLMNHLATYDEATPTTSIRPIHIVFTQRFF